MGVDLESTSEATSGAIGSMLSTTILYPSSIPAKPSIKPRSKPMVNENTDTAAWRMQTSAFGKSKGLWKTLTEGTLSDAFDGLGISLLLTSNPAIQYMVIN